MLKSLLIQNYVLIDRLDISFDNGFSVITGETGAGKSIILGAIGLALGQRADSKSIQADADKCVVEVVFDISNYALESFFVENDLEYDAQHCIIRRELLSSGKSRAFINDSPTQLSVLKTLGDRLIDIHSQHQNLLLSDTHFQLNVVDIIAQTDALRETYRTSYDAYISLTRELTELTEKAAKTKSEEAYIRHQYEELKTANLVAGEQAELEQELATLSHAEEIKSALYNVSELLNGDDTGVVRAVKEAISAFAGIANCYAGAEEFAERLQSAYIELKDIASETEALKEDVEFNPTRMEWVENRLNLLYSLQQKHHVDSADELIACLERFEEQLNRIDSFDSDIAAIAGRQQQMLDTVYQQAQAISRQRKEKASTIEQEIVKRMVLLGMPNTRFHVDFAEKSKPTPDGIDEINFLFSANKNETLKPVAQTASGGEISRLMLCIKALIAGFTALPAIIFDEVDTGTSGEIADKMADIMHELGNNMQVITITHLPQIAAKGNSHYVVYKQDTDERTFTRIKQLDLESRIREIARMLSGSTLTDASMANAKELLNIHA